MLPDPHSICNGSAPRSSLTPHHLPINQIRPDLAHRTVGSHTWISKVNRPAIPEPGRLENTSGEILPSRKSQKNSCLTGDFWPTLGKDFRSKQNAGTIRPEQTSVEFGPNGLHATSAERSRFTGSGFSRMPREEVDDRHQRGIGVGQGDRRALRVGSGQHDPGQARRPRHHGQPQEHRRWRAQRLHRATSRGPQASDRADDRPGRGAGRQRHR